MWAEIYTLYPFIEKSMLSVGINLYTLPIYRKINAVSGHKFVHFLGSKVEKGRIEPSSVRREEGKLCQDELGQMRQRLCITSQSGVLGGMLTIGVVL